MNRSLLFVALSVALVATISPARAQRPSRDSSAAMDMSVVPPASIVWADANVPGFAPGMKLAIISGSPDVSGALYTLRLSFPDGYRFPPHWHPMPENLTVLSGTLLLAMGDRADDSKLKPYRAGTYLNVAPSKPHFGGALGPTVIQLHGQGPFTINLVNASK